MAQVRLTKNELRSQQHKQTQLERYLPTLQLKKAMLQTEVSQIEQEIDQLEDRYQEQNDRVTQFANMLKKSGMRKLYEAMTIDQIETGIENIAGVEIPQIASISFLPADYSLFSTPAWWDSAVKEVQKLIERKQHILFALEKKRLLEEELRAVSIRVNLFEKILIPRTKEIIKKIKVFLGDQQLSAVATSKVAKRKKVSA